MAISIISSSEDPRVIYEIAQNPLYVPDRISDDNFPSLSSNNTLSPPGVQPSWTYSSALRFGALSFPRFHYLPLELRQKIYHYAIVTHLITQAETLLRKAGPGADITAIRIIDVLELTSPRKKRGGCNCFNCKETRRAEERKRGQIDPKSPPYLPNVCKVSELKGEASPVYIRECEFILRSHVALQFLITFLDTIPERKGYAAVRALRFSSFHWFKGGVENLDMRFITGCPALEKLTLRFHVKVCMTMREVESGSNEENGGKKRQVVLKSVDEIVEFYQLHKIFKCGCLKEVQFEGVRDEEFEKDCLGDAQGQIVALAAWMKKGFEKMDRVIETGIEWSDARPAEIEL
jgi:hypothetical protein